VRALVCGTAYLDRDPAVPFATQALEAVRAESGYTAHFARRYGPDVVYLETRESQHSTRLVSRVGRTLPAHATALGKALLAELTNEEIQALLPETLTARTPNTVTSREKLLMQCEQIRERGYALEVEEGSLGVRCAAAVIPHRIPGTDALSCSMPVDQATDDDAHRVGELLVRAADDLGRKLRAAGIR
jgi:DNA-binding IclR family transcriptional regulator